MSKKRVSKLTTKSVDFMLLFSVLLLIVLGMIMMYSASYPEALKIYNDTGYFFRRQLTLAVIGFCSMAFFSSSRFSYKSYTMKVAIVIFCIALTLNGMTFTSLGIENLGSRRWLKLGLTFMPSDVLKPAAILLLAKVMSKYKKHMGTLKVTMKIIAIIVLSFFIVVLQKDLGTAMVIGATLAGMILIGGVRLGVIFGAGTGLIGLLIYYINKSAERMRRFMIFRDPFQDKLGDGMQAARSLYAMGSGGLLGLGPGKSILKFGYLPECYNDFIFAIIGEELGLIGCMLFILLLMSIVLRSFYISKNIKDPFGRYLVAGFSLLVMIQSSVHILVNQSAIPTTGITLPFVSQGRTSLLMFMVFVGIVLNVSRHMETKGEQS